MSTRRNDYPNFKLFSSFVCALIFLILSVAPAADSAGEKRGWWPQKYTVERDDASGVLTLSTHYYTVQHDLKKGGVISRISLTHGRAENLLVQPVTTDIVEAGGIDPKNTDWQARREAWKKVFYNDLNNSSPKVSHASSGKAETVTVECDLVNEDGKSSGISVKTTYTYRWGYIKIRKEFTVTGEPVTVRSLCILSTTLDPSLTDYGYRPGVREGMDADLFSWRHGQIRQWGKIRPGTHFDLPFRTRQIPRYLVFANPGIEGIEWFVSDDLSQWDYQASGVPGSGYCEAGPSTDPLGINLRVCPVMLSNYYLLPEGGKVELKGTYIYDYYLSVPILEGHANEPWLDRGFKAEGGKWISEDDIRKNAESGVITMRLHNDGDHLNDGLFWRDGSYPPYPPEEMEKMDKVIENIHKHGMRVTPYFSNHELHQSTEEFKEYGEEWGRKVDTQGNLRPNYVFGAHMCLKSGWLDFLKFSIDRVLKNHAFDGVYYDWNIAMYCNNPLHVGQNSTGLTDERRLGTVALSPTTHWDIDELINLVEWTRERIGPDGIVMLHNTLVPMFATENFANYVVGMEFSYGKLSKSMPRPDELPLEWNFAGARSRTVIGYGTIARGAPQRLHRQLALTAIMTSVAPWPASDQDLEMFKILKPLGEIEQYKFEDWRNEVVEVSAGDCYTAVYSKPGEAYILLANYQAEQVEVTCKVDPKKLQYPLATLSTAEIIEGVKVIKLDVAALAGSGETVTLPADNAALLHIK